MRYQNWGKQGKKFVCYSQQTSRKYLIKDEDCTNDRFPAEEIESVVERELLRLSYVGSSTTKKTIQVIDPVTALQKELAAARKHLSRLYDFEDEDEPDDVLKEKIFDVKKRISHIEAQIRLELEGRKITRKSQKIAELLRTLQATWPSMSAEKKQQICQELIERVVLYKDGTVNIHLKHHSLLIEEEKD
jgi:hypothetical protein